MSLLTRMRVYHFLLFAGNGFIIPFIGLFFVGVGLTGTQIGLLGTLIGLAGLIAAPAWGHWSDRSTNPRTMLRFVLISTAVLQLLVSQQSTFLMLAILLVIDSLLTSGIFPISNIFTLEVSGKEGYGGVRLWGSLGWAIMVLVAGWLIERFGLIVGFAGYGLMYVLSAAVLPRMTSPHAPTTPTEPQPQMRSALANILQSRVLIGLVIATFVQNLVMTPVYRFEPIYLDDLGASETLIGLAYTIGALIEIPIMLWADRLIGTQGAGRVLRMGMLLHMVRMAAVLIFPHPYVIVAANLIHGIAYALIAIGIVVFISANSQPGQAAVNMALFLVTLPGLTGMAGGPLGGIMYDTVGAYWLYAVALGGLAVAWITLMIAREPAIAESSSTLVS
jgi:MFS transporter, PPP family, 3-phenylpropionic acid transporter